MGGREGDFQSSPKRSRTRGSESVSNAHRSETQPVNCRSKHRSGSRGVEGTNTEHEDNSPLEFEQRDGDEGVLNVPNRALTKRVTRKASSKKQKVDSNLEVLEPFSHEYARERWPARYRKEGGKIEHTSQDDEEVQQAICHYSKATVDGIVYCLEDNACVKGEDGKPDYLAKILEMFKNEDGEYMFCAQWFFRPEDTVIQEAFKLREAKRVFLSDVKDDNPLDCLVSKANIVCVNQKLSFKEKVQMIKKCDFYYDMKYMIPFYTFSSVKSENIESDCSSTISSEQSLRESACASSRAEKSNKSELFLLDLYAGCGAMSTGLCMGAVKSGINLVSKWAVDMNKYACESLEYNHAETKVWNMSADNFISLLKEWEKLCRKFSLLDPSPRLVPKEEKDEEDDGEDDDSEDEDTYQVESLVDICYGFPNRDDKLGLHFKVRWKGYSSDDDTWEPIDNLGNCGEKVEEFVRNGFQSNILPLPGAVDVVCGGPPCQGISGFNRFRNVEAPLEDEKNKQLVVFMDIVEFLKPSYVLMENVVDILKFSGGYYGRYAIGRLVSMNYQTRVGILAAGHYGVPQFRNRVFLWGCQPSKCLPPYPLPTHEAQNRATIPTDFKEITVAFEVDDNMKLLKALTLEDAIRDLPPVKSGDCQDGRSYGPKANTDFQVHIRVKRSEMIATSDAGSASRTQKLYDHIPLPLSSDDLERVRRIPKKKGANFRDLPGVLVDDNNVVYFDPSTEREMLSSGKPLVPDYAMSFVGGKSSKPFGRLWWDETVPTVLTRAEPHNQTYLHPQQDRVLTVRETARLQGFPDCYRLFGPIKERYKQVGNAVAFPVAFALGYCLGVAFDKDDCLTPLTSLPFSFPSCLLKSSAAMDVQASA